MTYESCGNYVRTAWADGGRIVCRAPSDAAAAALARALTLAAEAATSYGLLGLAEALDAIEAGPVPHEYDALLAASRATAAK